MTQFNYEKLRKAWREAGHTDKEVAAEIGITPVALSRKMTEVNSKELTGTQLTIICSMIGAPMDMFVTKTKRFKRLGE